MTEVLQPITITAATTLVKAVHGGTVVNVNNTTGFAITLPASSGDGTVFTLFYVVTIGSGSGTVVAAGSDEIVGGVGLSTDIGGVTILANTGDQTITLNGTTKGGLLGSWLRLTDVAAGQWMLEGFLCSSGTEADPFS